jgi:small subunit ribosomal protein S25e
VSKEVEKKPGKQAKAKEEKKQVSAFEISPELLAKVKKDLSKVNYITPSKLASNYSIAISTARKLLKQLEKEGVLKLYSPSRRNPIYIPKQE